jgi:SAM-dependent methyltransferase
MSRDHWEREAENWIAWARTLGHDAYEGYAPTFFDEIVPSPLGRTLEIGCGEGRVTRDLIHRGHHMVSVDASATLIAAARRADELGRYVRCDAAYLPFADTSFELVVAYNVLMDLDDLGRAVREAARVLVGGGRLAVCVTHPLADAGRFEHRSADAPFRIEGSYLQPRRLTETFDRAGLSMTFDGMAYPLESYARAFEDAGLLIETIREPAVREQAIERDPAEARWARLPNFLFVRAVRPLS